jgi:hypothetical protein
VASLTHLVDFKAVHLEVYITKGTWIIANLRVAGRPCRRCAGLAPYRIQRDGIAAEVDIHDNIHRPEGVGEVAASTGRHLHMRGWPVRRYRGLSL